MYRISVFPENIIAALDALAELGKAVQESHKIRIQNKAAESDNLGRETQSAEQDSKPNGKESAYEQL
jgi:hypothetical protein